MNKKKRPFIFAALCLMSMAGGAFGMLLAVLGMIDPELLTFATNIPGYTSIKAITLNAAFLYPMVKLILYGLSFFGALTMYRLRKSGFYFYSISQLLLLAIPYFMWNVSALEVFFTDLPDFAFSILFVIAFSLNISSMNQVPVSEESGTEK